MKKLFFVLICLFIFSIKNCLAWDTDTVHPYITFSASNKANNLARFLNDLGIANERFDSGDSRDFGSHGTKGWILLGSIWEDFGQDHNTTCLLSAGCRRFLNHYFDPVNRVGLNYAGYSGGASPIWGNTGEGVDGPNQWSWNQAKYYLYNALTNTSAIERNRNFAFAFRSLGQVLHLLEDATQPSHVRNDPHVSPSDNPLGSWIFNPSRLEEWGTLNGRSIDVSAVTAKSLPSFDHYFNGLASITNTNFFSDDTIFRNYSMPSVDQTDFSNFTFNTPFATVIDEDGQESRTIYITKTGGLRAGYKVAHAGYFAIDANKLGYNTLSAQFQIDDRVAQENAQILIPLAVEYSAGLLNYFFRGKMDMISNPNNSSQYVIKNESNEYMSGLFSLYYDDTGDNRFFVASWSLSINANSPSSAVTFTPPTYPEPKQKGTYILVFQGTLGNESGAVVGRAGIPLCQSNISISGPDQAVDGTQYTATGGTEPYTWSIDNGSITQDGVVSFSGQCGGTAIITVTDACGAKQEKTVTIPITVIVVSGPDTPMDGAQYTASGGKAPYTWSINKGSITQDGVITVSGQCGTITVTATDENGCKGTKVMDMQAEITISGPDAPSNGDQYTASGGTEPYTWSITKGTIDSNGIVTISGQCGAATVTVTDACGNQGSKDVRMPSGKWVLVSRISTVSSCRCLSTDFTDTCIFISGDTLTEHFYECCSISFPLPCALSPACTRCFGGIPNNLMTTTYQWRCP